VLEAPWRHNHWKSTFSGQQAHSEKAESYP
jgi:hypothetical protein